MFQFYERSPSSVKMYYSPNTYKILIFERNTSRFSNVLSVGLVEKISKIFWYYESTYSSVFLTDNMVCS